MIMLSIHICAATFVTIAVVIAHSGCSWAENTRGRSETSQVNDKTGSEVFHSKRPQFNVRSSHKDSPLPRTEPLTAWELYGDIESRIVGGKAATIEEFPFMASLQKNGKPLCSMSIITASWLLTAAHCIVDENAKDTLAEVEKFSITAGTLFLTTSSNRQCVQEQEVRSASRFLLAPGHDMSRFKHDVALVRVSSPLPFKEQIQPARLPDHPLEPDVHLPNGRRCYVSGWGSVRPPPDRNVSDRLNRVAGNCVLDRKTFTLPVLHKVTLPLLSVKRCSQLYPYVKSLLEETDHICTLSLEGKDACHGDSGGPLTCDGILVGIISWGSGCGDRNKPTIYSRVDKHLSWILNITDYLRANQASQTSRPLNLTVGIALSLLASAIGSMLLL